MASGPLRVSELNDFQIVEVSKGRDGIGLEYVSWKGRGVLISAFVFKLGIGVAACRSSLLQQKLILSTP